ncbi:MAG: flippase-like domain-containing protein [Gemmatimonadota bacterium]|nr:MAG: flippase-like domain-containing protein [Gemmatimonadota bacterium]
MKRSRRRLVFWLGTVLGLLLILVLLLRYDPAAVLPPILQSKIHLLVAVAVIQAAIQVLNAMTPVVLLGPPEHGHLSRLTQTKIFLALQPLAQFAPGRLTDFAAVPLLMRHHRTGALASSIVLDRLITLFLLLLLTPVAVRFVWPSASPTAMNFAVIAGLLVVGSTPFLLANRKFRELVNRSLLRFAPRLLEGFGKHTESLLHTSRARLLVNFSLTALKILLAGISISLLAANVGLSLNVFTATCMSVLIQLVTAVPLAPQGLGVAEGSLVLLFTVNGLPGALALSMGLIARILFIPVIAVIYMTTTVPLIAERIGHEREDSDDVSHRSEDSY